ncbi:MAG: ABC transporter ATP-binding protein [Oxalobacter sp.]|nr:ABC transporter ATP-binding protein [Oxalobacter sp.]
MTVGNDNILLKVRNLRVSFRTGKTTFTDAVKGISFDVPLSRTVALVGESGSGKSVSALAVMGLLPPEVARIDDASSIVFNGQELLSMKMADRRKLCGTEVSMVFQDPMSSLNPVFTVGYQIGEVLRLHKGLTEGQARERAVELLAEVGIPEPERRIDAYPHQLSGGQQQRVMIAMAIACEPKLLIADEPTTALDVTVQRQIIRLIQDLQKRHLMSVLFITHDLQLVSEMADDVIVMRYGEVKEQASAEQVFTHPANPYTRALMLCRPPMDSRPVHLPVIDDIIAAGGKAPASTRERLRGYQPDDEVVLEAKHICKDFVVKTGLFQKKVFHAVKDVSFILPRQKTLGIVGESGSGKTTLGLTVMRLHQATAGEVIYDGKDILALSEQAYLPYKRRIQVVFQNPYASLNPRFTVGQILMEPMKLHDIGDSAADRRELAYDWLKRVGLPSEAFKRYPHEFSGGQRQRIAIARCLTMRPEVLLCDESVSALDVSVQAQILNLLQDLQDEFGLSYLFISHDLSVVRYMADQVMVMKNGGMVEMGDADEIYRNPQNAYTRELMAAIPQDRYARG